MRHYSAAEMEAVYNSIVGERLPGRLEQGVRQLSAVPNYVLGSKKETENGLKLFRYGLAGVGNCVMGLLHQAPIPAALQVNLAPLANYAIGTRVIGLTLGAAVVAANEYAGGWLYVDTGTGQGECLRILTHPGAVGGAACLFTCLDALTIAFDGTTTCSLVASPYANVIVTTVPPGAHLAGIPQVTIPATQYGWFQRRGPAVFIADTAPPVVNSRTNAGANDVGCIGVDVAGTVLDLVGEIMRTAGVGVGGMINLMLE